MEIEGAGEASFFFTLLKPGRAGIGALTPGIVLGGAGSIGNRFEDGPEVPAVSGPLPLIWVLVGLAAFVLLRPSAFFELGDPARDILPPLLAFGG